MGVSWIPMLTMQNPQGNQLCFNLPGFDFNQMQKAMQMMTYFEQNQMVGMVSLGVNLPKILERKGEYWKKIPKVSKEISFFCFTLSTLLYKSS